MPENSETKSLSEPTEPDNQLYIWDTSNQRSLINLVPESIREAMYRLIHERPDLCDLDEQTLKKIIRQETQLAISQSDNQIRFKFWLEYDRAMMSGQAKMRANDICANVISVEYFRKSFLKNHYKVCWMLCPIFDFQAKATESLCFGVDEMRDILSLPSTDEKGRPIYKTIQAKITIFKILDARVNGAAVQRTLNINRSEVAVVDGLTLAEKERKVEEQIRLLEKHERDELRILDTSEKAILPDDVDIDV